MTASAFLSRSADKLGLTMGYGMRSRFGSGLLAASLLVLPIYLHASHPAAAENSDDEPFLSRKAKATPLHPAVMTGKVTTETEIVSSKNTTPLLTEGSADALRAAMARYSEIQANGGFPNVPKGTYKKGAQNKGVAALNRRLFMDGYVRKEAVDPQYIDRVTSATVDGVTRFQRNMGLAATGLVDGPTLVAMNIPVADRIRTMEANVARLETYAQDLGDRYLVVNVPSQQIETVSNGRVFSRHNAIVGRPERPTPVVMTALADINFNPYWNAPVSIVENDIIPKLRSGTRLLTDMNMRVFQGVGGPEIDPDSVNWSNAIADNYHFRQEPGPKSAMATAKINFSSPFGIYLHDTPEKQLFKSGERLFSSGCVRVEKVELLTEWILNGQDGIGGPEIAALAETLERRDVKLTTPPQLRVAYLTAWPVGNTVAFRRDVYGLDGTGFVVGQPLPEGETSADGQRFVLKPVERKAAAVEAAEAEGFGLFGSRIGKPAKRKPGQGLFSNTDSVDGVAVPSSRKLPFGFKNAPGGKQGTMIVKPGDKKKLGTNKDTPGLFDWAAYRKEQKHQGKNSAEVTDKKIKKKVSGKKVDAAVAVAVPKDKVKSAKSKPLAETGPAAKIDEKAGKKVAIADPKAVKKTVAPVVSKPEATAKKPVSDVVKKPETIKKVANSCAPDAKGIVPSACKTPVAKKPDVKKVVATP
jgi:L,D-transpeptidase YcbB